MNLDIQPVGASRGGDPETMIESILSFRGRLPEGGGQMALCGLEPPSVHQPVKQAGMGQKCKEVGKRL